MTPSQMKNLYHIISELEESLAYTLSRGVYNVEYIAYIKKRIRKLEIQT